MAHFVALPDVDASSGRFVKNAAGFSLGLVCSSQRDDQLNGGDPDGTQGLGFEHVAGTPQNAIDFAEHPKSIAVIFTNRVRFFNRNVIHDGCPEPEAARDYQNTSTRNLNQNSLNDSRNRFRVASCAKSTQLDRNTGTNAARHEGLSHLTALVHALSGALQRNLIRLFASHQIPSAISIAAPIRNFFGFAPLSSRSNSQSLRFAGATALAAISVAHPMLAKASGRVGV